MTSTSTPVLEARTTCPSCAAVNLSGSPFCWQCYARFPQAAPAPAEWARPDAIGEGVVSVPSSGASTPIRKVLLVALILAVVTGGFLTWRALAGDPFPGRFRTYERLDSHEATRFEERVRQLGELLGVEMHGAQYGHGSELAVLAILSDRAIAPQDLGSRFVEAPPRDVVEVHRDGATFVCFRADADEPGAACTWTDEETVGVVYGRFMKVRQHLRLTVELRAVVS